MQNYNSLVNDIKETLYSSSPETLLYIPNFIQESQQIICRECPTIGLVQYVTSSPDINGGGLVTGNNVVVKPSGWRNTLSFQILTAQGIKYLKLRTKEYVQMYWPDSTQTGEPEYYSDYGDNYFYIGPTPNQNYPFYLSYIEMPPPLSPSNQTNWLTTNMYDVLLNGALFCAQTFVSDDIRVPVWERKFKEGMAAVKNQDYQRILDRTTNRMAD